MSDIAKYKTEPLKCWGKAKELRQRFYQEYNSPKDGMLRWSGSAFACEAIPQGIGEVVHNYSEPYAATVATMDPAFAIRCQEAAEAKGFARDLCAYLRTYYGSMFLNRSVFGGEFPRPDFYYTSHICCSHAKWGQYVSDYENIPYFAIDVSVGPREESKPHKVEYVASQMAYAIEWLEKTTGREYDDEKLIEAINTECRNTALWGEICALNKAIPAPLDEKSMFSLYIMVALRKCSPEVTTFYEELRDEVLDRIDRGIAAVPTERFRLMSDSQPPWSLLHFWRHLESYGVVSIGSLYTFTLIGMMERDTDGTIIAARTPREKGIEIKTRDEALRVYADWSINKPIYEGFYCTEEKSNWMVDIARQWHCGGAIIHLNRGCEGTSVGQMENRLALMEADIPVITYEGNMADARECDDARIYDRIDAFAENLGLKRLET